MTLDTSTGSLAASRLKLIAALRSGEYKKKSGQLFYGWHNSYYNNYSLKFCCIGVACVIDSKNKLPIHEFVEITEVGAQPDDEVSWNGGHGYVYFRETYQVSEKQSRYLVAMNDGKPLFESPGEGYEFYDNNFEDSRVLRKGDASRDFKFIARYLEVLWGLS